MAKKPKWENVPKDTKDFEERLETVEQRMKAHRVKVATHYPLTWRLSASGIGTGLIIIGIWFAIVFNSPVLVPLSFVGCFTFFLLLWPADLSYPELHPDRRCRCDKCSPKKDLR